MEKDLEARLNGERFQNFRHSVRMAVWNHPTAFLIWTKVRRRWHRHRVEPDADLVIEGYPRSGNTFAYAAARVSQLDRIKIAHHTHATAQVMLACRYSLPTVVIIRHPTDAVTSYWLRNPELSIYRLAEDYIDFYGRLFPLQDSFLTVKFEDVVGDFNGVIQRINERFSSNFKPFISTPANMDQCRQYVNSLHRRHWEYTPGNKLKDPWPNKAKESMKEEIRSFFQAPRLQNLMNAAEARYQGFLSATQAD